MSIKMDVNCRRLKNMHSADLGQVIRAGKTAFFAEASLEDEKGRIIAKGTRTFFFNEIL